MNTIGSGCNCTCTNLASISKPNDRFRPTLKDIIKLGIHTIYYRLPFMAPLLNSVILKRHKSSIKSSANKQKDIPTQNIQSGDIVEILAEDEIRRTLDDNNKLKGLSYMPEMAKYCGRQFRVLKKVNRMKIESTGELRIMKNPIFILEGVYCDGEFNDKCDRTCFLFWRPEWFKKI